MAGGPGLGLGGGTGPDEDGHGEGDGVAGHQLGDAAVAVKTEGLAGQGGSDSHLPGARPERSHLLRDLAECGQDQPPGEFSGGYGGGVGVEIGGDDDPEPGAGVDVDVGVDGALADETEPRELLQKRSADLCSFADENE